MSRTGERMRRHRGGNAYYLGRFDTQVKITGYRIELSEIEHHALQTSTTIVEASLVRRTS